MKRIGIITLYYKSTNYGGNLQAYALCEALSKQGYEAEQIGFLGERANKSFFKRLFSGGLTVFFQKCNPPVKDSHRFRTKHILF